MLMDEWTTLMGFLEFVVCLDSLIKLISLIIIPSYTITCSTLIMVHIVLFTSTLIQESIKLEKTIEIY